MAEKNLMEEIQQVVKELGEQSKKLAQEHEKTEAALQEFKEHLEEQGKKLSLSVDHIKVILMPLSPNWDNSVDIFRDGKITKYMEP